MPEANDAARAAAEASRAAARAAEEAAEWEAEASREREARASRRRPSPDKSRRADASRAPRTPLEALEEARRARAADDDVRRVREAERMRAAGLRPPAPRASARPADAIRWRAHERAWAAFVADHPRPVTLRDVPFPESGADLLRALVVAETTRVGDADDVDAAFARARRRVALRWHPDKFQRWIGPRLAERADRERAIQTARDVYESAQAAFTARTRPA